THLAICPDCRERYAVIEGAGGELLDTIDTAPESDAAWKALKARIADAPLPAAKPARRGVAGKSPPILPEPLRSYVGSDVDAIRWKAMPGASQFIIPTRDGRSVARLLRIPAGKPVPEHTHRGIEMTLVISGAFSDEDGTFARGDIEVADGSLTHQPVATNDADCICLAVTEAPLKFKSWLVRLFQPILGI
ncbi:MAG: ChrR family anti-sigma-E factor, partial [Alphaproteobacteria bacterium]